MNINMVEVLKTQRTNTMSNKRSLIASYLVCDELDKDNLAKKILEHQAMIIELDIKLNQQLKLI